MMKNISVVEASRCIGGMRTVVPRYIQFLPTLKSRPGVIGDRTPARELTEPSGTIWNWT
jgi:hypothetical protein